MSTIITSEQNEADKAKLAYALTKRMPAKDGWRTIQEIYGVSQTRAQLLINKGRRLDVLNAPPIIKGVR